MFALVACALLGQVGQFAKNLPPPTGNNGYEEYIRAAEVAQGNGFNAYRYWLGRPAGPVLDDWAVRPDDIDERDSDLAIRRKVLERFKPCCDLISVGNQKPVYDPRGTIKPETLLPEFASFKQLGFIEANAAHVAFADGQTGVALARIEDGLTFGDNLGGKSILIGRLVGIACESILFSELDDHWPQLCLADATELRRYLGTRLTSPPRMLDTLPAERAAGKAAIEELFSNPTVFQGVFGSDSDPALSSIKKLNSFDQQHLESDTEAALDKFYDDMQSILSGPESGWLKYTDPPDPSENTPLKDRLVNMIFPSFSAVLQAELKDRIRVRLAYLTACAIEYRWTNGHLPDSIEQFANKGERTDPSTGASYRYKREGKWFRIIREGNDALGNQEVRNPPKPVDSGQGNGNPA